jgi:hypothetical protein
MKPASGYRRLASTTSALLALALLSSACGKGSSTPKPVLGGIVGFDQTAIGEINGPYPKADPVYSCGSDTNEFAAELAVIDSPTEAKVQREWGDVIKDRQYFISGTIQDFEFSGGDLTFTHPFANDITFNIKPDPAFADMAQVVGEGEAEGGTRDALHWEIERGLAPHKGMGLEDYLDGWVPQNGDRIATYGRWIIDCGHNDYHTELHPPTFVAFGHQDGQATVSHAWYNPYYYTQLLNPNPILSNQLTNDARFSDPDTKTFPKYLVAELLRVGHLGPEGPLCCHDEIQAHELLTANTASPIDWYVCAPSPKPGGSHLSVSYGITVRPGVTVTVTPDEGLGCAAFHLEIGPSYIPLNPIRKDCSDPWADLNAQAQAALGDPTLDVRDLIESRVPPSFIEGVERDPIVDCYDPLQVPEPGEQGKDQSIATVSTDMPYPFYGTITVSWAP